MKELYRSKNYYEALAFMCTGANYGKSEIVRDGDYYVVREKEKKNGN